MAWKYIAKTGPAVKDWTGSWGNGNNGGDFRVGGGITEKQGDTININFSDSGSPGGSTGNPIVTKLPFPVLDINTNVDTSTSTAKFAESLLVETQYFWTQMESH